MGQNVKEVNSTSIVWSKVCSVRNATMGVKQTKEGKDELAGYRKQAADLKRVSHDIKSLFVLSSWMYSILSPLFHYLLNESLSSYFQSSGR